MKKRDALLLELDRNALMVICRTLSVDIPEGADTQELLAMVMQQSNALPSMLVNFLSVVQLKGACRRLGLPADGDRPALLARILGDQLPPAGDVTSTTPIVEGCLVAWGKHEQLGAVTQVIGRRMTVTFDDGQVMEFVADAGVLRRVELGVGTPVTRAGDEVIGVILGAADSDALPTWQVSFPTGVVSVAEGSIRPAVINDPSERIRSGRLGNADDFNLRVVAADYWTSHHHNELVSLASARVDLKPHQVFVVHKVVQSYPHRFLLCDEVGLGKTIEAGMVIKELRARGLAKRVLVLVPSGLVRQWQFELKTKFNEVFSIYDATTIRYLQGKGVRNPWTDSDSVIASHTWASWTPLRQQEIAEVDWDMIIVDEAHHARLRRYGSKAHRTKLYQLVSELVARPEFARRAALFLTATPLSLERHELYSLVEMLNPILFASEQDFTGHVQSLAGLNKTVELLEQFGIPSAEALEQLAEEISGFLDVNEEEAHELLAREPVGSLAVMLRGRHRLSEVLIRNRKSVVGGFQPRVATVWEVELSQDERRVHELMERVFEEGFRRAQETNQNAIGFVMVILQKLLASSSRALLTSLRKRRGEVAATPYDNPLTPNSSLTMAGAEELLEEDDEASTVVMELAPNYRSDARFDEVIRQLEAIAVDSKAQVLIERLTSLFEVEPGARVVLFTEFRETQNMLAELLGARWGVNLFHGQLSGEGKDRAVSGFRDDPAPRVLISTEAGGEGRNFQFAHHIVNYDLPWNPMRVEQRIGRLDRIGQDHPINVFNFHVQGTIEGRIFDVLDRRIRIFEEAVGGLDPILGETEADIRKALRMARDKQAAALDRLGQRLEARVHEAREAGKKLADFILEAKSFSAEIAQRAMQVEAPIRQSEFELFLTKLLASAGTYIGPVQPSGEREVMFHQPFTMEAQDVIGGIDKRRVCFDPRLFFDSEYVEYFGFGHPIVDRLVRRVTEERQDGAAAVRAIHDSSFGPGWLFVWLMNIGGLRTSEFVLSVFVDDGGEVRDDVADLLLAKSRDFAHENTSLPPDLDLLEQARTAAERAASARRDEELSQAQRAAGDRADVEERRTRAVFEQRSRAAEDRIESCKGTLEKLRRATDRQVRQAIPLWEANLARAEAELESVADDLEKALLDIAKRRNPSAEYRLLALARVMPSRAGASTAGMGKEVEQSAR